MRNTGTAPAELVMRDLVDSLVQENPDAVAELTTPAGPLAPGERWLRLGLRSGWACFRGRPAVLQPYRLSRGPVWHRWDDQWRELAPHELLALLEPDASHVVADLRSAVEHTAVTLDARGHRDLRPRPGGILAGELLSATRGRPFHPTARAAAGWTAAELDVYGPMRREPVALDWVAVRRDHLRLGAAETSGSLHELLLGPAEREQLARAMRAAGAGEDFQPLPVHPWQFERVLPEAYADEFASGAVVAVARGIGRFHPTASLRTLTTSPESARHVKLPLGVSTLGAMRLLPPRYLDNGQRAEATMRALAERDPVLGRRVLVCDETAWSGWRHPSGADEFDDRPGQLTAQVRTYPPGLLDDPEAVVLPMAALAADCWDLLPWADVDFFGALADAFCEMGLSFLRHGVLPELHGQNVLVVLRGRRIERFVLRDHDTLRVHPEWMEAAGVPEPGYRIKPGARQSLRLDKPEDLLSYLQTLGFQVNLFGIADALGRHLGFGEHVFWQRLRGAVIGALERLDLPEHVTDLVQREVLRSPTWPCRLVLGPLLRGTRGAGVSMPAGTGRVPNPLGRV
ncbi:IucA/IucC family protein [Saccharopolyspora taberi]|uniref:IucA/IucC family protein n=1 Tax=Saccharopolyspora taberi TaxID=60895 RepID=A0ABN3V323_9PSEU